MSKSKPRNEISIEEYQAEVQATATATHNARRDGLAVHLMGVFLGLAKPSTFSEVGWTQSVSDVAVRAVRAADILLAELDREQKEH